MKDVKNNPQFIAFCRENYLNVEQTDPQWQAICRDENTVVSAGAGTGKTTVLSFRFLRIVAEEKAKPSEILTITFTRKATSEMKGRIYILMQQAFKRGFISEEDLKDFSNATISTVDSFCSEVVRRNSVSVGISRDFEMLSDEDLILMSNSIVDEIFKTNEDFTSKLLKYFGVSQIKKIFEDLSQNCLNIASPFSVEDNTQKLRLYLEKKHRQAVEQIRRDIDYMLPAADLKEEKIDAFRKIYEYCQIPDEKALTAILENWNLVKGLRKDNGLKNSIKEAVTVTLPACIHGLNNLGFASEFFKMAKDYETRLFAGKREAGLLSFNDIMQLCLKILTENPEQRHYYKNAFKYVMIDEFQDNNDDYRKLLFLLSEDKNRPNQTKIPDVDSLDKNKIFLVGDQKQSIYKFRGAEVDVFKRMTEVLCDKPIELKKNWRSEPQIINFCNDVFSSIMENQDKKYYEADFSDLQTRDAKVKTCHITLLRSREDEAASVANFIKEMCSENSTYLVQDEKTKQFRNVRYDEIGVLFKNSSIQGKLEKAFNNLNIPYTVTEPKSLMREALVSDFYCALTSALNPQDQIALASFLKSPFCAVKDADLLKAIAEPKPEILTELQEKIKKESLTSLLTYLWNDCGYRSFIASSPETVSYCQHYDWLFSIACDFEKEGKTVLDFNDYLRTYFSDEFKKLPQQTVFEEEARGVQLMTIHKSKGLAFQVVIVCNCDSNSKGGFFSPDNGSKEGFISMRYMPEEDSLENPVKALEKTLEDFKEEAETKRVLYVAATRPKSHLIFSGSSISNEGSKKGSMMDFLSQALGIMTDDVKDGIYNKNGYDLEIITGTPSEEKEAFTRKKPNIVYSSVELKKAIQKVSITSLEEESALSGERLASLDSDRIIEKYEISNVFGTRVHSILEAEINNEEVPEPVYPNMVSDQEIITLEQDAHKLADSFIKGSFYKNLKEKGAKFYTERPIILFLKEENKMAEGRIDLLCELDDQVMIVDFKTDKFKSNDKHKIQLELYKSALEKMNCYKHSSITTNVVYLREEIK